MKRSLAAGLGVLALLAAPSAARAHDGADGRIVWSRFTDDTFSTARIVSAKPDGSRLRVLSHGADGQQDTYPAPSRSGSRIAFERDSADGVEVMVVNANGSRQRTVDLGCVDPCDSDQIPNWTPDGEHLTFTRVVGPFDLPNDSARSAVLWVANLDGSHVRRLSQPGIDGVYEDYRARFLPDGRTITFIRVRNEPFNSAVFTMDVKTRRVRQLTPWELDADTQDVSSRGVIAFETFGHGPPEGQSENVATVPVDCGSLAACTRKIRYVTHNGAGPTSSATPGWAPDGRRIVFSEWDHELFADLWAVRPDGSDRQRVTTSPLWDWRSSWAF
jgi:TolB protein